MSKEEVKETSVRYKQANSTRTHTRMHAHTHVSRLTALCPGLPGWAGTRKVKPIWILLKQETVSGSGISWAVCKYASRSRQITTPAPHHSVFLQAGCPSCRPTNSIKALKAPSKQYTQRRNQTSTQGRITPRSPHEVWSTARLPCETGRETEIY